MKKKIIILASALAVAILAVLIVILSLSPAVKNCEKWIENSANNLTVVKTVFEATDKGEKVFAYSESVEIIEGNAEITKSTSRLNPSYEFSTISESSFVESINRKDLLNFAFDKKYFKENSLKKDVFTATVIGDCLDEFLGSEALAIAGDAQATLTFENKTLKSAVITFSLQSGKQVTITVECEYQENKQQ